ncbi:hypothetical protein F2P79_011929 [Pimephales promelas]|nr:hypothetical protein F2P79_011929 [Pimephales promelas]
MSRPACLCSKIHEEKDTKDSRVWEGLRATPSHSDHAHSASGDTLWAGLQSQSFTSLQVSCVCVWGERALAARLQMSVSDLRQMSVSDLRQMSVSDLRQMSVSDLRQMSVSDLSSPSDERQ